MAEDGSSSESVKVDIPSAPLEQTSGKQIDGPPPGKNLQPPLEGLSHHCERLDYPHLPI